MKKYDINGLDNRKLLLEKLSNGIVWHTLKEKIFCIHVDEGASKHAFFKDLYKRIKDYEAAELKIYTDFTEEDSIDEIDNHMLSKNFLSTFQISYGIAGLRVGVNGSSNDNRFELIAKKDENVVFLIKHWDKNSVSNKSLFENIIKNVKALEANFSKHIFFIFMSNDHLDTSDIDAVFLNFHKLSKQDTATYLTTKYNDEIDLTNLESLYNCVNGDIDHLTHFFDAGHRDCNFTKGIISILDETIKKINEKIESKDRHFKQALDLMTIIPDSFLPSDLMYIITSLTLSDLEELVELLESYCVLYKVDRKYYSLLKQFRSQIINKYAFKKSELSKAYCKLLKRKSPLDYIHRSNFLADANKSDEDVMALYVLAIGEAFRKRDKSKINEIQQTFNYQHFSCKTSNIFNDIVDIYNANIDGDSIIANDVIGKSHLLRSNLIQSELLKNDILECSKNFKPSDSLLTYCNLLRDILYNLSYDYDDLTFETIHYASCIIVLLPNYIDKFNDKVTYDTLNEYLQTIRHMDKKVGECLEYYDYIMNRKLFLVQSSEIAINACNKSLHYFKETNDISEQYMTLSGLIGLYITTHEFENAQNCLKEINELKDTYHIDELPGFYKTENNEIILDFLRNEAEIDSDYIDSDYIRGLMSKLEAIIPYANNVSKEIIYTNLCSFSLYIDELDEYDKYKGLFENFIGYQDVADVDDESIDDFYRYYFGWFELYKALSLGDKDEAKRIHGSLENFIPTIFNQYRSLLKRKHNCFKKLIEDDFILNGKKFSEYAYCNFKITDVKWSFFSRGLMVSDIQHTSFF